MSTLWVGIDEAGYGPNLGPLVMTAVVARSPDDRAPDIWGDLVGKVARAGGDPNCLRVDDSKAVYRGNDGRARLEAGCAAVAQALAGQVPATYGGLCQTFGAGSLEHIELTPWLAPGEDPPFPSTPIREKPTDPLGGVPWQLAATFADVVGPVRFNAGLQEAAGGSGSKARVHFAAFAGLLRSVWAMAGEGETIHVRGDKHGGRHFYYEPLLDVFPDAWIDRGAEGPAASRYTVREGAKRLELSLQPRADAEDGLVALASLVSKTLRELWMDAWNAHWTAQVPGLKPTAGYPVDAARFRAAIAPLCEARGLPLSAWWRAK